MSETTTLGAAKAQIYRDVRTTLSTKFDPAPEAIAMVWKLAKSAESYNLIDQAIKLLKYLQRNSIQGLDRDLFYQKLAVYTYKDSSSPKKFRLEKAWDILQEHFNLEETKSAETLGIAGAIEKRKWELDGNVQHLELSFRYYARGYEVRDHKMWSYAAINAAYILDLIVWKRKQNKADIGALGRSIEALKEDARTIREDIVAVMTQDGNNISGWWGPVTIAEAYFGLGQYDKASPWLQKAKIARAEDEKKPASERQIHPWNEESTVRQLASLVNLHSDPVTQNNANGDPEKVFMDFAEIPEMEEEQIAKVIKSVLAGKAGLALSGGGFRASLYHIGVLAKLAELDMLRHIEVISCVSGGSIIGAFYYLKLKKLLECVPDHKITQQHYIKIVQDIEVDFVEGVQKNIRTRLFVNYVKNLHMAFSTKYSRTDRAAELYERYLYSKIDFNDCSEYDLDESLPTPKFMRDLPIRPRGAEEGFQPRYMNWKRHNKVPILILNATSLNTGHNWQFTATWMGESPELIQPEIDGNYRLRRLYYTEDGVPQKWRDVSIGTAAGASACVPGIFKPIQFENMYEKEDGSNDLINVRLVDGGVFDNQGIAGLLGEDCRVLLVSDASGQMGTVDDPSSSELGVTLRAMDIFQSRIREAEYLDLDTRFDNDLLDGFMFIHLKKELDIVPVNWVGSMDPKPVKPDEFTSYGFRKTVQAKLAAIRTDLDSFTTAECHALMVSGYAMTAQDFEQEPENVPSYSDNAEQPATWKFMQYAQEIKTDSEGTKLSKLLTNSAKLAFKIWFLLPILRWIFIVLAVAALGGLIWFLVCNWTSDIVTLTISTATLGWMLIGVLLDKLKMSELGVALRFEKWIRTKIMLIAAMFLVFLIANLHVHVFDKWFLNWGSLEHLFGRKS